MNSLKYDANWYDNNCFFLIGIWQILSCFIKQFCCPACAKDGIALDDLVFYTIYFACYCVVRFVARAVSRKTPIPLMIIIIATIVIIIIVIIISPGIKMRCGESLKSSE